MSTPKERLAAAVAQLTPEELEYALRIGMTPTEYAAYKPRVPDPELVKAAKEGRDG